LADVLSYLYLTSATIKRYQTDGRDDDTALLKAACHQSFYQIQESLHGVIRNMPGRLVPTLLRWLVFPKGRAYSAPYDRFLHDAATVLLTQSEARMRLIEGIYISKDIHDQTGKLEDALKKVVAAQPVEKKIRLAVRDGIIDKSRSADETINNAGKAGFLTDHELQIVREARAARLEVIEVDQFPPDLGLSYYSLDNENNNRLAS
jgi:acyl-CoA dehydrogenase